MTLSWPPGITGVSPGKSWSPETGVDVLIHLDSFLWVVFVNIMLQVLVGAWWTLLFKDDMLDKSSKILNLEFYSGQEDTKRGNQNP